MAKTKLKIESKDRSNFEKSAEFSEVTITNEKEFQDTVLLELNFKKPSQLFECGVMFEKLNATTVKKA